jgi:transcriptional regulator with XRE-family HTH domain
VDDIVKQLNRRVAALGITRYEVARRSGLYRSTVNKLLDGHQDHRGPSYRVIEQIAKGLGLRLKVEEVPT